MKACVYNDVETDARVSISDVPMPSIQSDQVQIKIEYAGVNPVDWKISEGYFKGVMEHHFPVVLGWDGAGTITQVGSNVSSLRVGDRVFGYFRAPAIQWGTFAEYSVVKATSVVKIPDGMSAQVAASLPVAALTAWQALFDFANLQPGQTVLIQGGSGGVGSMAVQFAHMKGATVITTSSARNHKYLTDLGADWHIDYTKEKVVDLVKSEYPLGVDVVLDLVGGNVTSESVALVRKGGVFVSIVDRSVDSLSNNDLKSGFIFVTPDEKQLTEIASLYQSHIIKAPMIEELPLDKAREALQKVKAGHVTGKIVLKI